MISYPNILLASLCILSLPSNRSYHGQRNERYNFHHAQILHAMQLQSIYVKIQWSSCRNLIQPYYRKCPH